MGGRKKEGFDLTQVCVNKKVLKIEHEKVMKKIIKLTKMLCWDGRRLGFLWLILTEKRKDWVGGKMMTNGLATFVPILLQRPWKG